MGEWELSDAWVFSAINGTSMENGSTLADIIAYGDWINRSVLIEEEFVRAIPRLLHAGLIGADLAADRYWRTPAGDELFTRHMKRRGATGWVRAIPPALRQLGPPQDGEWPLPPGTFRRALREYSASWRF